jgi:hypothetical protein
MRSLAARRQQPHNTTGKVPHKDSQLNLECSRSASLLREAELLSTFS